MNVKNIILGCFVLLILIVLYYWFFQDDSKVNLFTIKKGDEIASIDGEKAAFTSEWTWSFWVHVSNYNYNYGKRKNILFRKFDEAAQGTNNAVNHIYLDSYQSDLVINTRCTKDGAEGSDYIIHPCKIENIPLQRWTHVLISHRARALDVYIDGKLVKSCILPGNFKVPNDKNTKVHFCPSDKDINSGSPASPQGFRGFLGTVRYYKKSVQAREAYQIYKEGYSGGNWLSELFNKYKLKIAFLEDNEEINSFLL